MTPLRQSMLDAMLQRGFAKRTQQSYVEAIYRMAKYYRRDPATYSAEEVQAYLLHMVKDDHLSYSTMNQAACAARFLFESVLGKGRSVFQIPMAKVPATQPELLAREEIARLFASCESPLHRILLQTVYATGLRVSEVCALRVKDIDSAPDRMCVRVECGKGGKTRYTLLSPTLLAQLRQLRTGVSPARLVVRQSWWHKEPVYRNRPACLPGRPIPGRNHQGRRHSYLAPLFCHASARRRR